MVDNVMVDENEREWEQISQGKSVTIIQVKNNKCICAQCACVFSMCTSRYLYPSFLSL